MILISLALSATFIAKPFPETVEQAPNIVRGQIGKSYAQKFDRSIYTFTELQVGEVLKGEVNAKASILIRTLGGEVEGVGMAVPGAASFSKGEDVLVFLGEPNKDNSYPMQAMQMGKYHVNRNADGVEVISGGSLAMHSHSAPQNGTKDEKKTWSVGDLKELIERQNNGEKAVTAENHEHSGHSHGHSHGSASPLQSKENGGHEAPMGGDTAHQHEHQEVLAGSQGSSNSSFIIVIALAIAGGIGVWILRRG